MKRTVAALLVLGLSVPAFAGEAPAPQAGGAAAQQTLADVPSMPKAYLWPGVALFAGGMAVAFNGFLNNRNGKFPEFGEADSTNIKMGAAGLTAAFGGGILLLLGKHKAGRAPSLTFGPGRVAVQQQIRW